MPIKLIRELNASHWYRMANNKMCFFFTAVAAIVNLVFFALFVCLLLLLLLRSFWRSIGSDNSSDYYGIR